MARSAPLPLAQIFSKFLPGHVQLPLTLPQLFLARRDLLPILVDFPAVLSNLFSTGSATNIPTQLGSILFQLFDILL